MMIYISDLQEITQEKYSIGFIHFQPFDEQYGFKKTEQELNETGVVVELPQKPPAIKGKVETLYYNPQTKKVFYEYTDEKINEEDKKMSDMNDKINLLLQMQLENDNII